MYESPFTKIIKTKIFRLLFIFPIFAALLLSFPQKEKDTSTNYVQMTGILRRFDPGIDYNNLHEIYRRNEPKQRFRHSFHYSLTPPFEKRNQLTWSSKLTLSHILLLVNSSLYAESCAKEKIDRYAEDIRRNYACRVTLETAEGGSASDIRSLIHDYYFSFGLDGAVLIGRLPAAWYEVDNDHYWWEGGYGYADWIVDLFYMDIDGLWLDVDSNGKYDSHIDGEGDILPEVFVGRIDTSTMGAYGDEVGLLCSYLDKNHDFWTGNLRLMNFGLVYIDYDWKDYSTYYFRHLYGSNNFDNLTWQEGTSNTVNKIDYLTQRLPNIAYGFTQLWAHSTWEYHQFYTGGVCYENEVSQSLPRSLGYNIIGCHACDWAAGLGQYFLGGSYIYNLSPSSLSVIGTTKVGGMLEFESFYQSLGENNCLGRAFFEWIKNRLMSSEKRDYIIGWHYGMTIIGDPLITFLKVPGREEIQPGIKPPSDFSVIKEENNFIFFKEYFHSFSWKPNPLNKTKEVSGYRLYELTLNSLVLLAEIPANTNSFIRRGIEDREYKYVISTVDTSNRESVFAFSSVK